MHAKLNNFEKASWKNYNKLIDICPAPFSDLTPLKSCDFSHVMSILTYSKSPVD